MHPFVNNFMTENLPKIIIKAEERNENSTVTASFKERVSVDNLLNISPVLVLSKKAKI
jgi:hypothetical protein